MAEATDNTPVFATSSATINAPIDAVWELISDIDNWPEWNPAVKSAELHRGLLVPGVDFRWKTGMNTITSQLDAVQPPEHITWTGSTMGIKAVHTWRFSTVEDATVAETKESWSGILPFLLRWPLKRTLQKNLDSGMLQLKEAAETRAS